MGKKWISLLIILVVCIGLMPAKASAADTSSLRGYLYVGSTCLVRNGSSTGNTSGTGWSYDYDSNVLTLKDGAVIEGDTSISFTNAYISAGILAYGMDLNIVVEEDASVSVSGENGIYLVPYNSIFNKLTITGGGTLNVSATSDGINAKASLSIDGTTVHVDCGATGLEASGTVAITNGATVSVNASGGSFGIYALDGITIDGGSKAYIYSKHKAFITSSDSRMTISGDETVVYLGYTLDENHMPAEAGNPTHGICDTLSIVHLDSGAVYVAQGENSFRQESGLFSLNDNVTVKGAYTYIQEEPLTIDSGKTLTLENGAVFTLNEGTTVNMNGTTVANGNGYVLDNGADIYMNGVKHIHDYTDIYYTNKTETTHVEMLRCKDCPVMAAEPENVKTEEHTGENPCECGMEFEAAVTVGEETKNYYTMDGALNSCTDDSMLKLLKDVSTSTVEVISGSEVEIDLNGCNWDLGEYYLEVSGSASVTIVDSSAGKTGTYKNASSSYILRNKGTLYLEGGTIAGDSGSVRNEGTLEVDGATIKMDSSVGNVIQNLENGHLELKNGKIIGGQYGISANSGSDTLLYDGFVIEGNSGSDFAVYYSAKVTVKENLTGSYTIYRGDAKANDVIATAADGVTPEVSWFETTNDGFVVAVSDTNWILQECTHDGYDEIQNNNHKCPTCGLEFEARTETVYYEKVAEAIEAGGNVTLLKSAESKAQITVPASLTLDLNGKDLSLYFNISDIYTLGISVGEKTVLKNSGSEGTLTANLSNSGTLEIENVTVNGTVKNNVYEEYGLMTYATMKVSGNTVLGSVANYGTLEVSGDAVIASVTNYRSTNSFTGSNYPAYLRVSENVVINNVTNGTDCFVQITGALGSDASIKCNVTEDGTVVAKPNSYSITDSDAAKFTSVDGTLIGQLKGSNVVLANKKNFGDTTVELSWTSKAYSAEEQKPDVTVTYEETTLEEGTDYTIAWDEDCVNTGEKTITLTGQGEYLGSQTATYNITPATISVTDAVIAEKKYNGTTDVEITSVTLAGICGSDTVKLSYKATLDDANAGTRTLTLENIQLAEASAKNYTLSVDTFQKNVEVEKADGETYTDTQTITNGIEKEYTVALSDFAPTAPLSWGDTVEYSDTITYNSDTEYSAYKAITTEISGDKLIIKVPKIDQDKEGTVATVTVTVESQNYEESQINIDVIATNKTAATLEAVMKEKTYDGKAVAVPKVTATVDGEAVEVVGYAYEWQTADGTTLAEAPKDAGSYKVVASILDTDTTYAGSTVTDFSIKKATPKGAPAYTAITSEGKTLTAAALTTVGGTFNVEGSVVWIDDVTTTVEKNKAYTWEFTPVDTTNYEILTGSSILWKNKSSSGSSSTKTENTDYPVQGKTVIILTIDSVVASVLGEHVTNDVAPVIRNNRTMLPIRFVAEALGSSVEWNQAEKSVTITKNETVIVIFVGQSVVKVNGRTVQLDAPAFIENNRTYLPVRFVSECLGATVTWNEADRTVTIIE